MTFVRVRLGHALFAVILTYLLIPYCPAAAEGQILPVRLAPGAANSAARGALPVAHGAAFNSTQAAGIPTAAQPAFANPGALFPGANTTRYAADYVFDFSGRLAQDFWTQFRSPFRFAKEHPKRALMGVVGLTALIVSDQWTYDVLAPRSSLEEHGFIKPAEKLSEWGKSSSAVPLVFGFAGVGLLANSPRERETSAMLFEALATSAVWTELLKSVSGRQRPRETSSQASDWFANTGDHRFRSFPSGHATGIWASATILSNQYSGRRIVPILAYGTALAMSYSRMALGAHWLSDVVLGGVIGYGSAKQVLAAHHGPVAVVKKAEPGLRIALSAKDRGFRLQYDF